jgi:hypothetical protein
MAAWWAVWMGLVAAGQGPEIRPGDDVRAAVAGLSAPRRAEREWAAKRLEALGEAARPALVEAAGSFDLELRARAAAVLDAIEGQALGRPTAVTLDFRDVPLADVLDAVAERTGLGLALQTWPDPRRGERKVTVEAHGPVSFWEAVERIGKAGEVRPDLSGNGGMNRGMIGMPMAPGGMGVGGRRVPRPVTGTEVMLVADSSGPAPPSVRSGRFLVALLALNHHRDRTLPGPHGRPAGSVVDRFEARLQLLAEPDLTVDRIGEVEGLEAEDDRGQGLASDGPTASPIPSPYGVYAARNAGVSVALRYPDRPGRRIKRIKGVLPVTVVGTRPDPVVTSLVEGLGRPARKGDVALTVHDVRPVPEAANVRVVELTLVRPGSQGPALGYPGANRAPVAPPGASQGWFEFVDEAGKVVARLPAPVLFGDDAQRRVLRVAEPRGKAVAVRYTAPAWATLAVPFEFGDLPMP